ncbi:MAG: ATP-dependent RNA helicase RhlE [Litorilinea sp.]|nr:MAG: ATP-dependent RNA helicase RhlE [Litorilinea sp.]
MNFTDFSLDARILAGIDAAGFVTPTPIQQQAIPLVLQGRDVLGLAQTGTGKTAAFMLPVLQRLTQGPLRRPRVLIIAPTRELAEQIHEACTVLGKRTKVRSVTIYGGVSKRAQSAALRRGPEVIVACPGRLLDHLGDGHLDLSGVEVLILDEADRMCDMGFLPDIRRILTHLPTQRQTLFFSATMPEEIRLLADQILDNPVTVQIGMTAPAETVDHALYPVPGRLKERLLLSLLPRLATGRVLVFTRTKRRARNLAQTLDREGYRVAALQGNMTQNRRQAALNGFRKGRYDILVATDIAARGIDVAEISHVINFDMPNTVDAYTHRIGRTGRAHQTGEAFTFAEQGDEGMVRDIERVLGATIERRQLAGLDYGDFMPERYGSQASQAQTRHARRRRRSAAGSHAPRRQSRFHRSSVSRKAAGRPAGATSS